MHYEYGLQEPAFTVGRIEILDVSRDKDYRYSYRGGRTNHGFIYIVRGLLRNTFYLDEEETVILKTGELMFIPKGSPYVCTYLEDNTEIKIVQFDLASGAIPEFMEQPRVIDLPNVGELIEAFFVRTNKSCVRHPFYCLSCMYELLWRMDEGYNRIPGKYRKLQAALSEMTEHCERNAMISHYAKLCDMSEVNFRRVFREYTGKSPVEYRNDIRLQQARAKLQSGEYNVSEAALSSGFSNLSFFIRQYKKKFGHTPKNE